VTKKLKTFDCNPTKVQSTSMLKVHIKSRNSLDLLYIKRLSSLDIFQQNGYTQFEIRCLPIVVQITST